MPSRKWAAGGVVVHGKREEGTKGRRKERGDGREERVVRQDGM